MGFFNKAIFYIISILSIHIFISFFSPLCAMIKEEFNLETSKINLSNNKKRRTLDKPKNAKIDLNRDLYKVIISYCDDETLINIAHASKSFRKYALEEFTSRSPTQWLEKWKDVNEIIIKKNSLDNYFYTRNIIQAYNLLNSTLGFSSNSNPLNRKFSISHIPISNDLYQRYSRLPQSIGKDILEVFISYIVASPIILKASVIEDLEDYAQKGGKQEANILALLLINNIGTNTINNRSRLKQAQQFADIAASNTFEENIIAKAKNLLYSHELLKSKDVLDKPDSLLEIFEKNHNYSLDLDEEFHQKLLEDEKTSLKLCKIMKNRALSFSAIAKDKTAVADAYYYLKNYKEAVLWYEKVAQDKKATIDDKRNVASAYFNLKNYKEAALWFEKVVQDKEATLEDNIIIARTYFNLKNYKEAAFWFEKLDQYTQATLQDKRKAANTYYNLNKYKKAASWYEEIVQDPQATLQDKRNLANTYFNLKNYKKAEPWFEQIVQDTRANLDDKRKTAYTYFNLKNYKKAEPWYEEIVRDPQVTLDDKRKTAYTYFNLKNYKKAEPLCKEVAQFPQATLQDKRNVAHIYYNLKNYEEAASWFEKVAQDKEAILDDKRNVANTYFNLKNYKKAEPWYKKVVQDKESTDKDKKDLEENAYML